MAALIPAQFYRQERLFSTSNHSTRLPTSFIPRKKRKLQAYIECKPCSRHSIMWNENYATIKSDLDWLLTNIPQKFPSKRSHQHFQNSTAFLPECYQRNNV